MQRKLTVVVGDKVLTKFFEVESLSPPSSFYHDQYCLSYKTILPYGDIELNSDPSTVKEINNVIFPAAKISEIWLETNGC